MKKNGQVSYTLLQQLMARAWDEGDMQRLMLLSRAVDQASCQLLEDAEEGRNAISCP